MWMRGIAIFFDLAVETAESWILLLLLPLLTGDLMLTDSSTDSLSSQRFWKLRLFYLSLMTLLNLMGALMEVWVYLGLLLETDLCSAFSWIAFRKSPIRNSDLLFFSLWLNSSLYAFCSPKSQNLPFAKTPIKRSSSSVSSSSQKQMSLGKKYLWLCSDCENLSSMSILNFLVSTEVCCSGSCGGSQQKRLDLLWVIEGSGLEVCSWECGFGDRQGIITGSIKLQ